MLEFSCYSGKMVCLIVATAFIPQGLCLCKSNDLVFGSDTSNNVLIGQEGYLVCLKISMIYDKIRLRQRNVFISHAPNSTSEH